MATRGVKSSLRQTMIRHDKRLRAELRAESQQTARDMANWLTVAVRPWSKKPRFAPRVTVRPDWIEAKVDVAGNARKIFFYVDQGTGKWGPKKRAYPIPKQVQPGKLLKFQTGYSAKTQPKAQIGMGSGQRSGGWVSKAQVMHPGIEPRKFSETVTDELKPDWQTRIEQVLRRYARQQG